METCTCVYGSGFCVGTGLGFVYKFVYTYNNIKFYYVLLNKIDNTIENKRTSSFSRVVVVGCSRELPTTLKTSISSLFSISRMEVKVGVTTLENEHTWLIFEDGGGGDSAKGDGGNWLMGGNGGGVLRAYDMSLEGGSWLMVVVLCCVVLCRMSSSTYDVMGLLQLAFEAREGGWVVVSQCITPACEAREWEQVTVVMWKTINDPPAHT